MKNILIPTDFSACATHVTEAGIAIGELFKSDVHLLHSIEQSKKITSAYKPFLDAEKELKQRIYNAIVLMNEYEKEAKRRHLNLFAKTKNGNFLNCIQQYISDNQIDLVVMGSHGASGKNERFIGSNTQKIIRRIHTPVLVIKHPLSNYEFKEVVFASNFDASEMKAYQWFLDYIRPFRPRTIHLLSINTSGWFSQPFTLMKEAMKDFKKVTKGINCKIHFHKSNSVDAGIRSFTKKINADLVSISNLHRRPIDRIMTGSNVEMLVNHADLPVLSIDLPDSSELDYSQKKNQTTIKNIFTAMVNEF